VNIRTGQVTALPASIASLRAPQGYLLAPGGDTLVFQAATAGETRNAYTRCGGGGAEGAPPFHACQIFVSNVDGSSIRQLTDIPGGAVAGGWSPDGTTIVAIQLSDASSREIDLMLIDPATEETTRITGGPPSRFQYPHFSPDGQYVLISRLGNFSFDDGSGLLFRIPVGGGQEALVFEDRYDVRFSPDGLTMAFTKFVSVETSPNGGVGGPELWLANADGSDPRPLVADEPFSQNASWSADGSRLVYSKLDMARRDGVVVFDMTSGTPTYFVRTGSGAVGTWLDAETLLVDVL
jgi:TolB protein